MGEKVKFRTTGESTFEIIYEAINGRKFITEGWIEGELIYLSFPKNIKEAPKE